MAMKKPPDTSYLGLHLPRRHFLRTAAGAGLLIPLASQAAPDQVHDLKGKVTINNRPATWKSDILPGDRIVTGNDGHFVFVMGQDAMMLRSRSELVIERHEDSGGLLRLLTGAMGAVFGRGKPRSIVAANVTAGIRGTGVYMETRGDGTYFCTCWGTVDLAATRDADDKQLVESKRHIANLITGDAKDGTRIQSAVFETHTDEEMDILEKCVGRRSPLRG
jgi:hypothetical protein